MKVVILENTWLRRGITDFGWGNGYVLIPQDHQLHGKDYSDIDIYVHGGLTFSEYVEIPYLVVNLINALFFMIFYFCCYLMM